MYALPEMAAANEAMWLALRAAADIAEPHALSPSAIALPGTIAPETVFSQMCGYPLKTIYHGQYRLLGTPLYDLPGCRLRPDGMPTHCSFLITRADSSDVVLENLRGRRFVMNGADSNSGMNLARRLVAPWARDGRFFGEVMVSGSHLRSMEMVAEGLADTATIDCVTYGFVARYRPDLTAQLRVVCETPESPAIPFITASGTPTAIAARLTQVLIDPTAALAAALRELAIRRVAPPRPEAYDTVLAYETEAAAMGYAALA